MAARHGETAEADTEKTVDDSADAPRDDADRPRAGGWLGHGLPWGNVWGTCTVSDQQRRHRPRHRPRRQQVGNGTTMEWAAWAFWTGCTTDTTDTTDIADSMDIADTEDAATGWRRPWPGADDNQATRASHVSTEAAPGSRSVA